MKLPQLHLRDLFWLVLVAAMGCAWWMDRERLFDRIAVLSSDDVLARQMQLGRGGSLSASKLRAAIEARQQN